MVQRETWVATPTCPDCGAKLTIDRDLLLCEEHGAFFAYGPMLLVRAPRPAPKGSEVQLPWETPRTRMV